LDIPVLYNHILTAGEVALLYQKPFCMITTARERAFLIVIPAVGGVTVEPATLELALTQHPPVVSIDCTVTPATLELALTQHTPVVSADCTVTPDTFELALTQNAPSLQIDCTVTPDTFELALTQHAPTVVLLGTYWIGIDDSHLDSFCGEEVGNELADTLKGDKIWFHALDETHFFILDLGVAYNITKVKGRSL